MMQSEYEEAHCVLFYWNSHLTPYTHIHPSIHLSLQLSNIKPIIHQLSDIWQKHVSRSILSTHTHTSCMSCVFYIERYGEIKFIRKGIFITNHSFNSVQSLSVFIIITVVASLILIFHLSIIIPSIELMPQKYHHIPVKSIITSPSACLPSFMVKISDMQ